MPADPPKVLISYSHDSPEHEQRVVTLADRLRGDGIDCIVDQYVPVPEEGWPLWMERQIERSDYVLMVCTQTYFRRVRDEEECAKGLGVRWEGRLIYHFIYKAEMRNTTFIPVLFEAGDSAYIPGPVGDTNFYLVQTEHGYEDLYRRLTNQPRALKPALGKLRSLPPGERKSEGVNIEVGETQQKEPPDCVPAHILWVQLATRIMTQPLDSRSGQEETTAESVFMLFPKARELMEQYPDAKRFCEITLKLLNGGLRAYVSRWHRWMTEANEGDGSPNRFLDESTRKKFRTDLRKLQPLLLGYQAAFKALSEGSQVKPEWLEPDEHTGAALAPVSRPQDAPGKNTEVGKTERKGSPDRVPAHILWVQLATRIMTQPLHSGSGQEETAAISVYMLFSKARELMEQHPDAKGFCEIALKLLNGDLRAYANRWHRWMTEAKEEGGGQNPRFRDESTRKKFRTDLRELQPLLLGYQTAFKALSEGSQVKPEWLEPD